MSRSTTSAARRIRVIAAMAGGAVGVITLILLLFFFELAISLITAAITGIGTTLVVSWRDSPSLGIEAASYITSAIFAVVTIVAWMKLSPGDDGPLPASHVVATAALLFAGGLIAITGRFVRVWT